MSSKRWSIRFKSGGFNLSAAVDEDDGACDAEAIVARETRTSNQGVDAAVLVSLNGDSPAQPFKDQQQNSGTVRCVYVMTGDSLQWPISRQKSHRSKGSSHSQHS